nr:ATP-binding protein [Lysinibacillus odysseyi]
MKEMCTCRFIANGENRIILGTTGVGKTTFSQGLWCRRASLFLSIQNKAPHKVIHIQK